MQKVFSTQLNLNVNLSVSYYCSIIKSPSQRKIIDKIWHTAEDLELDDGHVAKYEFKKKRIQDGGLPPY